LAKQSKNRDQGTKGPRGQGSRDPEGKSKGATELLAVGLIVDWALSEGQEKRERMDIEVRIRGLMMDPSTNMPIVVLKDVGSEAVMPIWVGIFEANAIALEIEKMTAARPMTHDLTRNLVRHLNGELEKVVITELKDDTFYAVLWMRQGDEQVTVDARPSDAIALALRADCPIYVADKVMESAKLNTSGPPEGPTAEQLRGWLEGLNDEDLGRYKM
jgi:bifunctional DNase/RNase